MKRFVFYPAILLIAAGLGFFGLKIYNHLYIRFEGRALYAVQRANGSGRGATYKSADGERLESNYLEFSSPQIARAALQSELQEAVKIIERKPLLNAAGEEIGERVVALFPPNEIAPDGFVVIIRQEGNQFFDIASASLRHAIAFENGAPR